MHVVYYFKVGILYIVHNIKKINMYLNISYIYLNGKLL